MQMIDVEGAGIRQIPQWCNSPLALPISAWYSGCQPYTEKELHDLSVYQMQKIADVNPELAASSIQASDTLTSNYDPGNPNMPDNKIPNWALYIVAGGLIMWMGSRI
jgi:hypothetical protein